MGSDDRGRTPARSSGPHDPPTGELHAVSSGDPAATLGEPDSPGVTKGTALDTLTAPFNDLATVDVLFDANPGQIAAVIVEPVVGNMGLVTPDPGFLEGLKLMQKGGKYRLWIPANLAYGAPGMQSPDPEKVPGDAMLVFTVSPERVVPAAIVQQMMMQQMMQQQQSGVPGGPPPAGAVPR